MKFSHLTLLIVFIVTPFIINSQEIEYKFFDKDNPPLKGKRIALVIGNGAYTKSSLKNPKFDASKLLFSLTQIGFDVDIAIDIDKNQVLKKINNFKSKIDDSTEIALFYYIGHGFHVKTTKKNYILPIGANIKKTQDVGLEAVEIDRAFQATENNTHGINIFIFDACFEKKYPSKEINSCIKPTIEIPAGSYFLLSNAWISKNKSYSSVNFTDEFIKALEISNIQIEQFFKEIRINVYKNSGKKQVPWNTQSVDGYFILNQE